MSGYLARVERGDAESPLMGCFPTRDCRRGFGLSFDGPLVTPADVIKHVNGRSDLVPMGIRDSFNSELQDVARRQSGTLTVAEPIGLDRGALSDDCFARPH